MLKTESRPASTKNYSQGRFGRKPEVIVVHLMAGSMAGTAAWFADPVSQVSAHYGVSASGAVHQYVALEDTAWHAGDFETNKRSIGIEHEGMHDLESYWKPTPDQLEASIKLAAALCSMFGITPSRQTILLHSDVNPKKPVCPGPGFPIEHYIAEVAYKLRLLEQSTVTEAPVRLFDPGSNTQIGVGTHIVGTDKVYLKRLGPLQPLIDSSTPPAPTPVGVGVREEVPDMGKIFGGFYNATWVNGGILGKVVFGVVAAFLAILLILAFSSLGRAQEVDLFNPATWFTSTEVIIAVVGIFMGWIVKLATALGKDWFNTSGNATVALSAILAAIIAGVGGYQALGMFGTGAGGIQGAVQAVFLVLIAFLGSNASAKADRQAAASGLTRGAAEADAAEAKAKARLQ